MLAKNNNGVFPTNAVYETIHGLKTIPAHGTREMPIWGEQFNPIINLPHYVDPSYWKMAGPEQSPEVVVRTRILAVIDYLSRVQQKEQPTSIRLLAGPAKRPLKRRAKKPGTTLTATLRPEIHRRPGCVLIAALAPRLA